ncbi:hypothetical protein ACGFYU_32765 [Streptomyces sp. NPDC048337]|uniref:hypothetical protein n=1 Tax=Streptomyces sp. NPDC048337 TaxID=3365535 RepID=UPI0037163AC4
MTTPVAAPVPATPQPQLPEDREALRRDRRARMTAGIGLCLLIPSLIAAFVAVLSSPRAGRCITYGEGCAPGAPGTWVVWAVGITLVAGLLAVSWPARRLPFAGARAWMTGLQITAHTAALLCILSHYA